MDMTISKKQIHSLQTIYEGFDERPVDCDFVLPEYMPDIASVLKCIMTPTVQTYQVSGDRVTVDGTVMLQVLYLDEGRKCVRCFENVQPFTAVFTVKNSGESLSAVAKTNYVNCRATGPRRVDVHGAFTVKLSVQGNEEEEIIDGVENSCVFSKSQRVSFSRQSAYAQKHASVNEVIEISSDPIEMILRTEAIPSVTDCRILPGKAIVKGEVLCKTVYVTNSTSGEMAVNETPILFSQIIDVEGLTEEMLCDHDVCMSSWEMHPTQNVGGENKLLSFGGKLCFTIRGYQTENARVLTDVYHTKYPLKTERKASSLYKILDIVSGKQTASTTVELSGADNKSVLDCWCTVNGVVNRKEGKQSYVDVQLIVSLLVCDEDNTVSYYERPAEICLVGAETEGETQAAVTVIKTEARIGNGDAHITLTLSVKETCYCLETVSALCQIEQSGETPYAVKDDLSGCCMKVYFASAGESVWDIAKTQHVSVDDLCAENALDADVLPEDTMLLLTME